MKTYEEVIDHVAKSMLYSHMSGGSKYNGLDGSFLVSFIYGVPEDKVLKDAEAGFRKLNGGLD